MALIEEINFLNESEQLLQAIYSVFDYSEIYNRLHDKYWDKTMPERFYRHINFDDSE
jgi:hypothetical protein